ncbi:hypothetical protein D1646_05755 [Pseudoflavonifractor sp. 60]|uniref:recombinase family protein n=1 Tax=Pseudoflavonifractor sp. 60 TaxID=2304576 RepID=UPI00136811DC|nr:recombinase family protein [Pseudoflavonifractor sp. 60]NBI66321.1 hypothetical protein [Pseudoflavonifractor sp. 60]
MEFFSCQKPEIYRCYAYGRLSRKDQKTRRDSDESNSIKNQRDLIHEYIGRHPDLELCMEGYDDNYSGTNFDRPHFQEMMRAIEEGKIDCIVVKDDCVILELNSESPENTGLCDVSSVF